MSVEAKPIDTEDTFEGEETLGAELREKSSLPESETTDIYPDAVVNIAPESAICQRKRESTS